jgi:hypothetical protein
MNPKSLGPAVQLARPVLLSYLLPLSPVFCSCPPLSLHRSFDCSSRSLALALFVPLFNAHVSIQSEAKINSRCLATYRMSYWMIRVVKAS